MQIYGSHPSDAQKDLCGCLTNALLHVWSGGSKKSKTTESCESLLHIMLKIGDASAIVDCLKISLDSCSASLIPRVSFSDKIITIGQSCGWNVLKAPLEDSFRKLKPGSELVDHCKFLQHIYGSHPSDAQKDVCRGLASVIVTMLYTEKDIRSPNRDMKFLLFLFQLLLTLGDNNTVHSLVQVIITKPNCYPLFDTLMPLCEKFSADSGNDSFKLFFAHCIACVESSHALPCSYDWSQPVVFSCSCNDCVSVVQFLKHSTEVEQMFRMSLHIEHQLKDKKCSVTCVTEHTGRPHTLVVTKALSAGQKAAQHEKFRNATLSHLRSLAGLPSSSSKPTGQQQEPLSSSGPGRAGDVIGLPPSSSSSADMASSSAPPAGVMIGVSSDSEPAKKRQKMSDAIIDLT